jgi:hypothetical protein
VSSLLIEERLMLCFVLRAPARLAGGLARALSRFARIMMLAVAGLGPPQPRVLRHEDAIAQVADADDAEGRS